MTLSEEIGLGETQTLEFKRVPNVDRIKYQKTAVAFANGRGGRILFGVANDRSVDREPCPDAKIDERRVKALCSRMYRIARANCRSASERRAVKRVTPEQLQSWGIVSQAHGRWTGSNAYALLTGDGAYPICVRCGVFKGDDKAVFVDRRQLDGSVCDLIDQSLDYILAKINMGCDFVGARRRDIYELPPDALRELIVNAFVHRNYFDHEAPVFVAVYDTRVEIASPGGLPRGLTREEALSGRSCIRNHALAAAFNYMHYVEGWGSGFKRVNEQLAESGVAPVSLQVLNGEVRLNVHRKTEKVLIDGKKVSFDPEKSSIDLEKSSIESKKSSIGNKKLPIESKKSSIERMLSSFTLTRPTHDNIVKLYLALDENEIFGRQKIMKVTRLATSAAGTFLSGLISLELLAPVKGHGKGKYRFKI